MQFATESALPLRRIVAETHRPDPIDRARRLLASLLTEREALAAMPLARRPGAYARTFLLGDETVSVWAITWAAGAETGIHDHHCSCCFGLVAGTLTERWFDAIGDGRAVKTREAVREAGFTACMVPTGPNIHQMVNTSDREAISIHVYGFDRERHASSVLREYRSASL